MSSAIGESSSYGPFYIQLMSRYDGEKKRGRTVQMLALLIYMDKSTTEKIDGYFRCTSKRMKRLTGIGSSVGQAKNLKLLKKDGVLLHKMMGSEHKRYFKIDYDKLNEIIQKEERKSKKKKKAIAA